VRFGRLSRFATSSMIHDGIARSRPLNMEIEMPI